MDVLEDYQLDEYQQITIRKRWHEFFIKNRDRFTDSKKEAAKDKDKIYIENCGETAKRKFAFESQEITYRGKWNTIELVNLIRKIN